jgi:DNA-binding transcriptional LysR family regulator
LDYPLLPPEAAIDPSEDPVRIDVAMVLRDQFAQDSPAVRAFFDALVQILAGDGRHKQ